MMLWHRWKKGKSRQKTTYDARFYVANLISLIKTYGWGCKVHKVHVSEDIIHMSVKIKRPFTGVRPICDFCPEVRPIKSIEPVPGETLCSGRGGGRIMTTKGSLSREEEKA
jgi:hypothetical protein